MNRSTVQFSLGIFFLTLNALCLGQTSLDGDWQQTMLVNGKWIKAGVFRVSSANGSHAMSIVDQPSSPEIGISYGISNVKCKGKFWTFDSKWGPKVTGNFALEKVSENEYSGYSYLNGERRTPNIWTRVTTSLPKTLGLTGEYELRGTTYQFDYILIPKSNVIFQRQSDANNNQSPGYGVYQVNNGNLTIAWLNDDMEITSIEKSKMEVKDDHVSYRINDHSGDPDQVGLKMKLAVFKPTTKEVKMMSEFATMINEQYSKRSAPEKHIVSAN